MLPEIERPKVFRGKLLFPGQTVIEFIGWENLHMKATFDVAKTVEYWLRGASYDLDTGKSLLEAKRFPYALFFGHLALEKVLKALVVKATQVHAPYTHSLALLATRTNVEIPESVLDRLAEYTEFHLEARYPDEKKEFYEECTEEFAAKTFEDMENLYRWLTKRLDA